jgi:hypothetical protein
MRKKKSRKFVVISKVGTETFVKYRSDNFENLIQFLIKKYASFRFANIYCNEGVSKGKLIYTYGIKKGLQASY